MEKQFNVTGACMPDLHYMVDIAERLKEIQQMIGKGDYFAISRARQYGKTTMLACLRKQLADDYVAAAVSFEGMGREAFLEEDVFCRRFLRLMYVSARIWSIHITAPGI